MFDSEVDPSPSKPLMSRPLVMAIVIVSVTTALVLLATTTNVFTRGTIQNLPLKEREVLSSLEEHGVRVVSLPSTSFGAPPQIVPDILWQHSAGEYAVTSITLLNAESDNVVEELQKLTKLKKIRVPYSHASAAEKLQKQFPNAAVTRSFK